MRKSCADFAVCACVCLTLSVPFSLLHVSLQARSGVSVTVTGDQTIFVRLGAEPQRCARSVTPRSAGAAVLHPEQNSHKACGDLKPVALQRVTASCYLDSQMAHEPIHQHCVTCDHGLLLFWRDVLNCEATERAMKAEMLSEVRASVPLKP